MIVIDYKLIISNINYYICRKGITRMWISEMMDIHIQDLNSILEYKRLTVYNLPYRLHIIAHILDLDMEELNDKEFKEKLDKQIELEDFRFCQLNNIVKLEEIRGRSNNMIDLLENKDKDYEKLVKVNLDRIRELCDDIEKEI